MGKGEDSHIIVKNRRIIFILYFHFHLTNMDTKYLKNKYSERRSGEGKI